MAFRLTFAFSMCLFLWGLSIVVPRAQSGGGALVVTTCGTLPQAFVPGSTRSLTVNTNGVLC
jgi:hypothetical protein